MIFKRMQEQNTYDAVMLVKLIFLKIQHMKNAAITWTYPQLSVYFTIYDECVGGLREATTYGFVSLFTLIDKW